MAWDAEYQSIAKLSKGEKLNARERKIMSKTLKVTGILSGAVALTSATLLAAPAQAKTVITWKELTYGKYLEIYQAGTANGNWADIYQWNGGNNQKWSAVNLGFDSFGNTEWAFVNYNSGKCLEDRGYEKTGHVDQWACGNYGSNSRWEEVYNPFNNNPPGNSYALWNYGNNEQPCPISGSHFWLMWDNTGDAGCTWS